MAANPFTTVEVTTPTDLEIVMTRALKAPAILVFDAWTQCQHLKQWWGPSTWSLPECEIDLRPGGRWRYLMRAVDGSAEMGMYGEYREVERPTRLVSTEYFEGEEFENMGGGSVNTMTLNERDGATTLTITSLYKSKEARDGVLQTGMEEGVEDSFRRLEELLASLAGEGN